MQISDMIPGLNIIGGKVRILSINGAWKSGGVLRPQWRFYGAEHPKKIFSSKEHLDWLKTDLNAAEMINCARQ